MRAQVRCLRLARLRGQALEGRVVPVLHRSRAGREGERHLRALPGITTLFAALDIATGQVSAALKSKHRHQESLAFSSRSSGPTATSSTPKGSRLHPVMDNYAAHKHAAVWAWLADNPRFVVHFTPTHASWMNLVEIWFGIVERQAIRRGVFKSVKDLNTKIRAFIDGWHDRAHPFVWTKTTEEILAKANRPTTPNPRH
jgi:hypothetical protein